MSLKPILLVSALAAAGAANADLLAGWNFNNVSGNAVPPTAATAGTGSYSTNANAAVSGTAYSGVTSFAGTTNNAVGTDVAGQALAIQGDVTGSTANANNGKYVQFTVSTLGYQDAVFSYSTRGTANGFNLQTVSYSVDGTNFVDLGTNTDARNTTFATKTFSLASVAAADNVAALTLRITLTGATGQSGNNRFDNVQVNATQAVPEPASMAALGLGAVAMIRRRRSAK